LDNKILFLNLIPGEHEITFVVQEGMHVIQHLVIEDNFEKPIVYTILVTVLCDGTYEQTFHYVHGASVTIKQTIILAGEGASADIFGTVQISGTQHYELIMEQRHDAVDTKSNLLIKTVLDESAKLVYKGLITINRTAAHSVAQQINKNLLLSPKACVQSIPSLEALNHDVQCGHGTATSFIDEWHLFYLYSRGICPQIARTMLIDSFLQK
jgi:Fe-S cluster assembly protein SufD